MIQRMEKLSSQQARVNFVLAGAPVRKCPPRATARILAQRSKRGCPAFVAMASGQTAN
jgi:hypothetical protein